MAKRPYLDDLQTARLWAKVKALVSPLSSSVVTGVWNESQGRIEF